MPCSGQQQQPSGGPVVAVLLENKSPRLTWCTGCPGHNGCCWTQHCLAGICWALKSVQGPAQELLQRAHQYLARQLLTDHASRYLILEAKRCAN